jgi:MazG family protein
VAGNDPNPFDELVAIMDRLRGPDGCPWDREQTFATLRGYLLEEAYEVAEALDHQDLDGLREELGDLLFQIVFLSRLAAERGAFGAADVARGIARKMIRRHPHVFADATAETAEDVLRNWEAIKREEKGGTTRGDASVLDGIPAALPALLKAQRLGTKAARVGFDWARPADVLDKAAEELGELRRAVEAGALDDARDELGDALFALAMAARHLSIDPEAALEAANAKFRRRFAWIERELRARGIDVASAGMPLLDELWTRAKVASDG